MKMRLIVGAAGVVVVMFLMPSCSSDDGDDGLAGAAGSSGAAGGTGAAGAAASSASAGSSGAAGSAGAGGTASSGGTGGSMGAAAPADPVDSGGAAGSGGPAGSGGAGASGDSTGALSFGADVLPVLQEDCGDCHAYFIPFASDDAQASYEAALEPSSYEGVDRPRYDIIVARVEDGTMPPECGGGAPGSSADCVTEADFELLRDWANSGEPPPR